MNRSKTTVTFTDAQGRDWLFSADTLGYACALGDALAVSVFGRQPVEILMKPGEAQRALLLLQHAALYRRLDVN